MIESGEFLSLLRAQRALLVVRAQVVKEPTALALACIDNGFPLIEITLTTSNALEAIAEAKKLPGAVVGAGTVRSDQDALAALAAGADFLVGPALSPAVAATAARAGIAYLPGALTPTEISACLDAGLTAIKIFPAQSFGSRYLGEIASVFPQLRPIPSGAIGPGNASEYLDAGAWAVCVGGSVLPPEPLASGNLNMITDRLAAMRASLPSAP